MFLVAMVDIVSTLSQIVREFGPRMVRAAWQATLHPEDEREWRFVWIWFWCSFIYLFLIAFITGFLLAMLAPLNAIATWVWLVYALICQPAAYFVYGKGFEFRERYVETGTYEDDVEVEDV